MCAADSASLGPSLSWKARFLGCAAPALAIEGILEGALLGGYSAACLLLLRRPLAWLFPWLPVQQRPLVVLSCTCGMALAASLLFQAFVPRLGTGLVPSLVPALALAAVNPLLWLTLMDGATQREPSTVARSLSRTAALLLLLAPVGVASLRALSPVDAPLLLTLFALFFLAVAWNAWGQHSPSRC